MIHLPETQQWAEACRDGWLRCPCCRTVPSLTAWSVHVLECRCRRLHIFPAVGNEPASFCFSTDRRDKPMSPTNLVVVGEEARARVVREVLVVDPVELEAVVTEITERALAGSVLSS